MGSLNSSSLAIASAAGIAAAAYLNAKFTIGTDLQTRKGAKLWAEIFTRRAKELGDTCTLWRMFDLVDEEKVALWFEGREWTYGELKDDVNRLAAFLSDKDVKSGICVATFMSNSPEMVITILAISKLGAFGGLINSALRDETLAHCMSISTAQMIISTPDLSEFITGNIPHFSLDIAGFAHLNNPSIGSAAHITPKDFPPSSASPPAAKRSLQDVAVLIFTSGTTGKPKACAILNNQFLVASNPLAQDVTNPKRYFPLRQYSCLPLFHGTALFTGLCYSIGTGETFCLGRKFSSSRFWKEVTESRATRIIYVGELCRYLIAAPPSPYDRAHSCIVAHGNGLRGEVWEKFRERFGVAEIREVYRSTEGLAKFDNFGIGAWGCGKIGFSGPLGRYLEDDNFIVRVDLETEMLYRDPKTGFCIRAKLGEPGEVIARVRNRRTLTEYLGNKSATESKLLRDVFRTGDCFQRMGDLVVQDEDGWVSFHDRIGDTFRWKGENVSAGEVRDHISKMKGVQDVAVYGVKLPSYDGQAGAAAITLETKDSPSEAAFTERLAQHMKQTGLPSYAMPRLVRIVPEMITGITFKQAKSEYQKRLWDPKISEGDSLYWLNGSRYERLEPQSWRGIVTGAAKL